MHWHIQHQITQTSLQARQTEILDTILKNRGMKVGAVQKAFLHPSSPLTFSPENVGLRSTPLKKAIARLARAISTKEPVLIYGDYDADGITATAILWETLTGMGANAYPFIPSRELHGYGLSLKGITDALEQYRLQFNSLTPLVITVDNGITAAGPAQFLKEKGIDLIITDHHQLPPRLPPALAIVHTDEISGAGVAWMLAKELVRGQPLGRSSPGVREVHSSGVAGLAERTLDLLAIGTVADLMPVVGVNRSFIKYGLKALQTTHRLGLKAMFAEAGISPVQELSTYHIGYIIAPRLNAMGRLEHALDSLRLLLTKDQDRARSLAQLLGETNKARQDLTQQHVDQALGMVGGSQEHILVIDHEDFHEGVIGLVAGKLVEKYYRPAIVIARKDDISKASARSVTGVNIVELIRTFSAHLESVGGHPMAAGFSISTEKIASFRTALQEFALKTIAPEILEPHLKLDCKVELTDLTRSLYDTLENFKPFGIGNPKPVFAVNNVQVLDARTVGVDGRHLKLLVGTPHNKRPNLSKRSDLYTLPAISFNLGHRINDVFRVPSSSEGGTLRQISLAATLEENTFNGRTTLQLNLKDIKITSKG